VQKVEKHLKELRFGRSKDGLKLLHNDYLIGSSSVCVWQEGLLLNEIILADEPCSASILFPSR